MNRNVIFYAFLLRFMLILRFTYGHPINREAGVHRVGSEKKYPNGTIVGKYSYLDQEGNPTHVRYFADNSSYGVELKSVKISINKPEVLPKNQNLQPVETGTYKPLTDNKVPETFPYHEDKSLNYRHPKHLYTGGEPQNTCEKGRNDKHKRPDYDVYVQKELDAPLTCGKKEKIMVYLDEKANHDNTMSRNKYKYKSEGYDNNV